MQNYEDKIYYSLGEAVTEQTQAISQAVQKTLENNGGVGIMTGYYDQNLSILSVSNLLLHSTGHTFDTYMEQTKGSLKNFFMTRKIYWSETVFLHFHGTGEAQIHSRRHTVNDVRLCKEDATDEAADRSGFVRMKGQLGSCKIWHCLMRLASIPASGILIVTKTVRL